MIEFFFLLYIVILIIIHTCIYIYIHIDSQRPFQEPKMEVPTYFGKAYFSGYGSGDIPPSYMALYGTEPPF